MHIDTSTTIKETTVGKRTIVIVKRSIDMLSYDVVGQDIKTIIQPSQSEDRKSYEQSMEFTCNACVFWGQAEALINKQKETNLLLST